MGQQGNDGSVQGNNINEEPYTKARELWNKFIRGQITSQQLEEHLGGFKQSYKSQEIKDLL